MTGKMFDMLTVERRDKINAIDAKLPPLIITGDEGLDEHNWGKRNAKITRLYLESLEY